MIELVEQKQATSAGDEIDGQTGVIRRRPQTEAEREAQVAKLIADDEACGDDVMALLDGIAPTEDFGEVPAGLGE